MPANWCRSRNARTFVPARNWIWNPSANKSSRDRARRREKSGPEYWRRLEELAGTEDFQEALHREFPKGASEWVDTVSRRGFLKVMGASTAWPA